MVVTRLPQALTQLRNQHAAQTQGPRVQNSKKNDYHAWATNLRAAKLARSWHMDPRPARHARGLSQLHNGVREHARSLKLAYMNRPGMQRPVRRIAASGVDMKKDRLLHDH